MISGVSLRLLPANLCPLLRLQPLNVNGLAAVRLAVKRVSAIRNGHSNKRRGGKGLQRAAVAVGSLQRKQEGLIRPAVGREVGDEEVIVKPVDAATCVDDPPPVAAPRLRRLGVVVAAERIDGEVGLALEVVEGQVGCGAVSGATAEVCGREEQIAAVGRGAGMRCAAIRAHFGPLGGGLSDFRFVGCDGAGRE